MQVDPHLETVDRVGEAPADLDALVVNRGSDPRPEADEDPKEAEHDAGGSDPARNPDPLQLIHP